MTILVTAFSAPEGKLNASELVLRSLEDTPHPLLGDNDDVVWALLDSELTSVQSIHESLTQSLVELIYEHRPSICVFLGQAPGRGKITVERIGSNYLLDRRIIDDGPVGYWSTLPRLEEIPGVLEALGVPAAHSNCAGSTLCNHVLYSALHLAETQNLPLRSGFVHLPLVSEQAVDDWEQMPHLDLETLRNGVAGVVQMTLEDDSSS